MDDPNRDPADIPPDEQPQDEPEAVEDASQAQPGDEMPASEPAPAAPENVWIPAEQDDQPEPAVDDSVPTGDTPEETNLSETSIPVDRSPDEQAETDSSEAQESAESEDLWDEATAGATAAAVGLSASEMAEEGGEEELVEEVAVEERYPDEDALAEEEYQEAQEEAPPPDKDTRLYNWLLVILGVLFIISICFLGYLFFGTRGQQPDETPAASPTGETGLADPVWDRIQSAGRLVSGTSGDYPPFAFYNATFQLDGFDVALLNEVSQRLGFPGLVQDIAFDGLQNALAVGQIDLAAAAISFTPERAQVLAFSDIYYSGEDAFLAQEGSGLTVRSPQDLAGRRVAVERSTIYERWARENLVGPGLIRENQLLAYHQIDPAINDLQLGRADVVILDLNVADEYLAAGGLTLAGRGLNPQYYAIAMQPGAPVLLANVNQALAEIQQDGTLDRLAEQFLGQPIGVIPTPTQAPPAPTATAAPCIDAMEFIADLTYDDQNMTNPPVLYPGERFAKGWRFRNTGTCTWDSSYRMVYVGGNVPAAQMGGVPTPIVGTVAPGAVYDMYVQLTAPFTTGVYQGFWQLQNGSGLNFGSRVWVGIFVSPTGEVPTEDPPIIQRFVAEPLEINTGGCVDLSWRVEGQVDRVRLQVNGEDLMSRAPTQGSLQDCPAAAGTYEYTLRASGPGGNVLQNRAVVARDEAPTPEPPQPEPPVINSFTAEPATVNIGQCTNLNWNVGGDAELVRILRNGELAFDTLPAQGFGQDCFQNRGQVSYELQATGVGQTVSAQQQVTVNLVASYELVEMLTSEDVLAELLPDTRITLEINNENISGSSGCNSYTSTYQLNGEELVIAPPQVTAQSCEPPELMTQEARYFELLDLANRFNVTGDRLELIVYSIDPLTRQPIETVLLVYEQQR